MPYIKIEITRYTEDDNGSRLRSRTLLQQEMDPEKFDLESVIEAVNFPDLFRKTSDLDLRRLAEKCAATGRQMWPGDPSAPAADPAPEAQALNVVPVTPAGRQAALDRVLSVIQSDPITWNTREELAQQIVDAIFLRVN